jgi:hypothetical protein
MAIVLRNTKGSALSYAELDGNFTDLDGRISKPIDAELVLAATSVSVSQEPTGTDSPMQINYGPAVGTGSDPVELAADGTITFHDADSYAVALYYQFGRMGASGTSELIFRSMIDIGGLGSYVQAGDSVSTTLSNANDRQVIQLFLPLAIPVADTKLKQELIRDSNGNDSGGLFNYNPTLAGVLDAPSASLFIFRYNVAPS